MSFEMLPMPGVNMMTVANDYMETMREGTSTAFSFAFICSTGFSHALESLLHIVCLPLKYISPQLHRSSRIWLLRLGWCPVMLGMWLANRKVIVTGDKLAAGDHPTTSFFPEREGKNKQLLIMNHQAYADTFFIAYHLRAENSGDGTMMWAIWKYFLFSPLGWASYLAGHIFLGFGKKKDKENLDVSLNYFVEENFRSFCVYPEGGLFFPRLLPQSWEYARKEKLPQFHHMLIPRFGAYLAALRKLREAGAEYVFDLTVGYPSHTPWHKNPYNLIDLSKPSPVPIDVHLHIRQFCIQELGETEEEQKAWLINLWKEKDAMMATFAKTQHFPGEPRDGSPGIAVLGDALLWAPFLLLFAYAFGLAGMRFTSVAMTLFYMVWVSGASASFSLPDIWGMWIGGFLLALVTAAFGPVSLFSLSIPSLFSNRRRIAN